MFAGGMMMWLGIPLGWLVLGSQVYQSSQPNMGAYMLVFGGILVSMIVMGKLLSSLNRSYTRLTGEDNDVRIELPWHKSMRAERESNRPTTVLEIVMVASVVFAGAAMGVWFFLFAGSPF